VEKLDQGEARRKIWGCAVAASKEYPLAGTGLSSHVEVYPTYYDGVSENIEYTHAENGYLQVLMETGIAGLAIAALFISVVAWWCLRGIARSTSPHSASLLGAITAVLAMNLVHSITDFIWYVPALMAVVLVFAAAAVRTYQLAVPATASASEGSGHFGRMTWAMAACGVAAFAAIMVRTEWPLVAAEPHWFSYIHLTRAMNADESDRPGATPDLGLARRRLATIAAAVRSNPNSHRAQLALARSYIQYVELKLAESENAMPLSQIRDAAKTNFESVDEMMEWLEKPALLGERRKMLSAALNSTRRALKLCPVAGRGYLTLSELAWLEGAGDEEEEVLIDQAYVVRPHDPRVHFVLGRREFIAQNFEPAMEHWREAFDRDPSYRKQLIRGLAELVPPAFFLKNFEMDLDSMRMLWTAYEKSPDEEGKATVLVKLAEAEISAAKTATATEAVKHWLQASQCYRILNDPQRMLDTAQAAVDANRNSVAARQRLGTLLYEQGDFEGAADHLTWCVNRQPDNGDLRNLAQRAIMQQGKARTRVAKEPPQSTTR
jgi:tetratricopeptide (TPR) repeat protein